MQIMNSNAAIAIAAAAVAVGAIFALVAGKIREDREKERMSTSPVLRQERHTTETTPKKMPPRQRLTSTYGLRQENKKTNLQKISF